jgi:hypothetical protein
MLQRLAAIPVGYALEAFGKRKGWVACEWLGHYLTCRGTKKVLTPEQMTFIYENWYYRLNYHTQGSYWLSLDGCPTNIVAPKGRNEDIYVSDKLYYALGKVLSRTKLTKLITSPETFELYTSARFHLLDYYTFYPTCNNQSIHGRNCRCTTRTYKSMDLVYIRYSPRVQRFVDGVQSKMERFLYRVWHKMDRKCDGMNAPKWLMELTCKLYKLYKLFTIGAEWGISDNEVMSKKLIGIIWLDTRLQIEISDKVFTWFGKPFYTVGHYEQTLAYQ